MVANMSGVDDQTGAVVVPDVIADHEVSSGFPFSKSDIKYWVVKRKDGVVAKYILTEPPKALPATGSNGYVAPYSPAAVYSGGFRDFCDHKPDLKKGVLPIVDEGGIKIYIADAQGLRDTKYCFDYILDCGDVLSINGSFRSVLAGDTQMVEEFKNYVILPDPRLLKIDWTDRQDPPLDFDFWPAYVNYVLAGGKDSTVVTACQGGHGRSGTSLVCLLMALLSDYTPYAAICHLRALHCPRAIESKVQHEYIGKVGEFLGRPNDVNKVEGVKDFKEAFLALDLSSAKKYQERLKK